ncbi:GTPase IMAP family member 7-like [Hoplias malabaricus]|uniref:GTPase IMAP family member 7-like n=1 Tax=Hoplias malabaricus TaxID=27720 RepID=UPI003461AACD
MGQAEAKSKQPVSKRKQLQKWIKGHAPGRNAGRSEALQLVLVGPKGSGKSSAGNSILGKELFETGTETLTCKFESCEIVGRPVTVVDTPGLTGSEASDQELIRTIQETCQDLLELTVIYLLVVPLEWSVQKSQDIHQVVRHTISKSSPKYLMVLITHTDLNQKEEAKDETILLKQGPLQLTVCQCGGWFHLFNIVKTDQAQVSELLEKLNRMMLEGKKNQDLDSNLEELPKDTELAVKSFEDPKQEVMDYRVAIMHQKKKVQKRIEMIKNSERIIAENKKLLRELRDEIDAIEEELKTTVAEDKKRALTDRMQVKASDVQDKEEKILMHISILQTLQKQVEEKQQNISQMRKEIREREKEYTKTNIHCPRTKNGFGEMGESEPSTSEEDCDKRIETEGVMERGGMHSFRKNLQKLEEQMKSKRQEEENLLKERNSDYKAQLQRLKEKRATN